MQDIGKLTIEDLSVYIPHGIYFQEEQSDKLFSFEGIRKGIIHLYNSDFCGVNEENTLTTGIGNINAGSFRPILFPASMLSEEIQYGGERFVPLKRIFEMHETGVFEQNRALLVNPPTIISCEYRTYEFMPNAADSQIKYHVPTSNMGDLVYSFVYDHQRRRFIARDETNRRPLGTGHQLDMFKLLHKWHFWLGDQRLFQSGIILNKARFKK